MRKFTPYLLAVALLYSNIAAYAQPDSGYTDLGRVKLNTVFTQAITIQGKDLEKIPFSSLDEAINVYLYGAYSKKDLLVYVIDGNLVNDVNAYSVYDIETVTLVQNALSNVNGVTNGQRLVLIKTRTGKDRPAGLTVAGGSYLVSRREDEKNKNIKSASSPDFFHQYHVSGQTRKGRSAFGGSADWLRKIWPATDGEGLVYTDPYRFSRFRFNAWFNTQLGKHSELSVNMNAAPQREKKEYETFNSIGIGGSESRSNQDASGKKLFLSPSVRLFTQFSKGWSNDLSAAYVSARHSSRQHAITEMSGTMNQITERDQAIDLKDRQLIIRDYIHFQYQWNYWQIAPAVNLMYRNTTFYSGDNNIVSRSSAGGPQGYPTSSISESNEAFLNRFLVVTPSVSLGYKDYFSIQGGIQTNTNLVKPTMGQYPPRLYPFITAGANLVRMIKPESGLDLKLFGSYAKTAGWSEITSGFTDLSSSEEPGADNQYAYAEKLRNTQDAGEDWQAGLNLQLSGDRLQVSYNYENKISEGVIVNAFPIPGGMPPVMLLDIKLKAGIHRVGIMADGIATAGFNWRTGINAASIKSTLIKLSGSPGTGSGGSGAGSTPKRDWTGGWVNHFSYKKMMAGFNMLYHFNDQFYKLISTVPSISIPENVHTFVLQDVYLGYRFSVAGSGNCEIYASGRNLLQSDKLPPEIGALRYYGLGVKIGW